MRLRSRRCHGWPSVRDVANETQHDEPAVIGGLFRVTIAALARVRVPCWFDPQIHVSFMIAFAF